ncbi:hypothetical protein BCR32DRAFT_329627 [Anaeromyces robustus]|uniref:feruloyl esterase n=1 Tax=Anaeromyces robustus TaxID=1754192 RepID=A0A1Y1WQN7_9FUNG|nr:hypothetical protein BCR32DRAFT_329627 [Anaeromyces robustus]|eukprot:ORX75849.1 hypothetical protein BCR32DRAFT_329627 [Anaeromyces robustus]
MKAIIVFSALAALTAKTSAQCFSEKLGYKCCKDNMVVFEDKDGLWGIENNEWCGISDKDASLKKRQWWGGQPWDQGNQQGGWGGQPWGGQSWNQGGQQGGQPWGGQPWDQGNQQGGWGGQPWNQGNQQGGQQPWEQNNNNNNNQGNPWEQNNNNNNQGNPWEQNNNNNNQGNPWEQNNNNNAPPTTDNGNTQGGPPTTDNGNTQGGPPTTDNGNTTTPPTTDNGNANANGNTTTTPQAGGGGGSYPYPLKNAAVPSKGCGKNAAGNNGSFNFNWSGGMRNVLIDLPQNYDSSKPYRLVFGMHCMGGSATGVRSEGYYGLKPLDTQGSTIFVAPEGNGQQMPWGEADYKLFDELLEKLKNDYCIDESRVFSTGFSYGSMFSNGLSWNHQKVLRGVAVYETAERNIYLPQHTGDGIGWMGVLGFDDGLCTPEMGRHARDIILEHNSEGGKAVQEKAEEAQPNGPHKCYDYTTVDEKFPVRWCTQSGGHLWDHKDPGQGQSWVPQATWEFINKF